MDPYESKEREEQARRRKVRLDNCPVCGIDADSFPQEPQAHYRCPLGHSWHVCAVHRVKVAGPPPAPCSCPAK